MMTKKKQQGSPQEKTVRQPHPLLDRNDIASELTEARRAFPVVPGPKQIGVNRDEPATAAKQDLKKNFAQRLSDLLALKVADGLRRDFPGILPTMVGDKRTGVESAARTVKGVKKLDINYSTVQLGLGLGVSIKTLNFRDAGSRRYTKNVTRIDNELRAEAGDYHERQPFAVLAAILFMPQDSASDAGNKANDFSSFAHAAITLRFRAGRSTPRDSPDLFERLYIALYDAEENTRDHGQVVCFDAGMPPPRRGMPRVERQMTLEQLLTDIKAAYDERNVPKQVFDEEEETRAEDIDAVRRAVSDDQQSEADG